MSKYCKLITQLYSYIMCIFLINNRMLMLLFKLLTKYLRIYQMFLLFLHISTVYIKNALYQCLIYFSFSHKALTGNVATPPPVKRTVPESGALQQQSTSSTARCVRSVCERARFVQTSAQNLPVAYILHLQTRGRCPFSKGTETETPATHYIRIMLIDGGARVLLVCEKQRQSGVVFFGFFGFFFGRG